jgi:hypothetical protein
MAREIEINTIEKYSCMMFSSRSGDADTKAVIMITSESQFLGYLNFMADGAILPETDKKYNLYYFYYHMSDLPVIIDLLRNESPVYIFYMADNKENCRISTTMEMVGEGEM